MKDNFLLKKSQREIFNSLSNEDAGKLIKGVYEYVNTGDSGLAGYLMTIFITIKIDIDKNEESYRKRCEINRANGSKGGAPKGNKNASKEETTENNQMVRKSTENNMNNHNHIHSHNHNSYIIKEIINYLNTKTNSNFRYTTKSTQAKIDARLNEGYVLDDFIVVIDKKYREWVGTEFEKYLCPETLFGTKFEKYLQQKEKELTTKDIVNAETIKEFFE